MKHYILTYKLEGKLTGIAGIELGDNSCLNDAFKKFILNGFPNPNHHKGYDIKRGDVETQKNYFGRSPIYREI